MKTYEKTPNLGRIYMNFIVYFIYYLYLSLLFFWGDHTFPEINAFGHGVNGVFLEMFCRNPGICFGIKSSWFLGQCFESP